MRDTSMAGPVRPPRPSRLPSPHHIPPLGAPSWLIHPTLVSLKKTSTASAAFSFHSYLTEGALGCFHKPSLRPSTASRSGAPGPALREQVVAGLFLSSPAPPARAPVAVRPVDLVLEIWPDSRVPRQELVVAACYRLTRPAEGSTPDVLPAGGAVLSLRPHAV